jgi:hypothetical protein
LLWGSRQPLNFCSECSPFCIAQRLGALGCGLWVGFFINEQFDCFLPPWKSDETAVSFRPFSQSTALHFSFLFVSFQHKSWYTFSFFSSSNCASCCLLLSCSAVAGLIAELLPRALCFQTQHKLISKRKMKAVEDTRTCIVTRPSAAHTGQVLVFRVKYTSVVANVVSVARMCMHPCILTC